MSPDPSATDNGSGKALPRALIVEDEPIVRRLTARALSESGFSCDEAEDGKVGFDALQQRPYEVVVTDLRMPRLHGHAFILRILQLPQPPMIVVLTGVAEKRLIVDLLQRGVTDVVVKPVDYDLFGAKVAALYERYGKTERAEVLGQPAQQPAAPVAPTTPTAPAGPARISREELTEKLRSLALLRPISDVAREVYRTASSPTTTAREIAALARTDEALAVQLLRVANSALLGGKATPITDMEEAVVRLGSRRIADVALAVGALFVPTVRTLRWLDTELIFRRSLAAGLAIEEIWNHHRGPESPVDDSVYLTGLTHLGGRLVLASLYPDHYRQMMQQCQDQNVSLLRLESEVFPHPHFEVMADLLELWRMPSEMFQPLRFLGRPTSFLRTLDRNLRARIQALLAAIAIGRLAVGKWQPWDSVYFPDASLIEGVVVDPASVLASVQRRLHELAAIVPPSGDPTDASGRITSNFASCVLYFNTVGSAFDYVRAAVECAGVTVISWADAEAHGEIEPGQIGIVNTLFSGDPAPRLVPPRLRAAVARLVVVCAPKFVPTFSDHCHLTVALPGPFRNLEQALLAPSGQS
ncbi:MAG: HDOD domain-containing protein [Candidatus Schekmanbacteria bacterium]|nr:HDOD domain-containing protein [Candidatus Schekmanbacteria bacterium]